jgi:two-component system response regulator (stage 0 sporulation protein F)
MSEKQTILYVDDEPINLQLFEIHTEKHFNVLTAESGMSGLEILEQNPQISVIFSDMKMPGMNGLQFIGLAREKRPDIFYFILTGYDITSEIADAINNKTIVNYYRKPYNPKIILESIKECLDIS